MHVAAEPTRRWLTRQFLQISFDYPFNQTKVRVILSPVASGNAACIRFIEHLGFTLGATLKNAHPDGDLLLYTMQREQCRWLNILKDTAHGQSERATAT